MALRRKVVCRRAERENKGHKHRSSAGQVAAQEVEPANTGQNPKVCPIEKSFKITEEEFERKFKTPIAGTFSFMRELMNDVKSSSHLQQKHKEVMQKIKKVDNDVWDMHRCAPLFARRLRIESQ